MDSFDWRQPAQELRIPLEKARALYDEAMARHPGSQRARSLYLELLRAAVLHQSRVPGRRTLTMGAEDPTRQWPLHLRRDGRPIAPGKQVWSATPAAPWQPGATNARQLDEALARQPWFGFTSSGSISADIAGADIVPARLPGEAGRDLRFQLAEETALEEVAMRVLDTFASGRRSDPWDVPPLSTPLPRRHPPRLDPFSIPGAPLLSGQPVGPVSGPAWPMGNGAALVEIAHRRAATIFRRELADADVDLHDPAIREALDRARQGAPLPDPVRQDMEARLGADFRHVRIHTDTVAARAAEVLHASAFTLGEDIFFAASAYAPASETGQRLLVHELTHVVQAQQGRVPSGHGPEVSRPGDTLEREAEAAYDRLAPRVAALNQLVPSVALQLPAPRMLLRAPGQSSASQTGPKNARLPWDASFVLGFVRGLLLAGGKGFTPEALTKIKHDFTDPASVAAMAGGNLVGILEGALQSLWDNLAGLGHIVKWLLWDAPAAIFKEVYQRVTDPVGAAKRDLETQEKLKSLIEGMTLFALAVAKNPEIMTALGDDIGTAVGDYVAHRFTDFANASPFDKGRWIGKGTGYILMEVALLLLGPETLALKIPGAATKIVRAGGKGVQAVIRLMEKIPQLRKLLQAAGRLGKIAEAAGPEAKLLAHLDQTIVQKVLQQGLKHEEIAELAKLEKTAAEKLLQELPAQEVLDLEKRLGKGQLEKLAKDKTGHEIQAIAARVGALHGVWQLDPFARGVAIENALGRNLPGNFPVIDRFSNGVATSIKSIDLNAKSYENISALTRTVTGYIDGVAAFQGRTWAGATVRQADITGRALELAIPAGGGTAAQQAALQSLVQYGRSVGVNVTIIPF